MALGDRLGWAGVILTLCAIGASYLWPDKKWIGWTALSMAFALGLVWAWLEFKPQAISFYRGYPLRSTMAVFFCSGLLASCWWLWAVRGAALVQQQTSGGTVLSSPLFSVAIAGIMENPYPTKGAVFAPASGLPENTLASVDFMPVIRITNTQPVASSIRSYSLQLKDDTGKWRELMKIEFPPQIPGVTSERTLFWVTEGRVLTMTPNVSLDDELAGKTLTPGQSVSGWAYFAYPASFNRPIRPPSNNMDVLVTVTDWAGRNEEVEVKHIEPGHEPNAVPETHNSLKIGKGDLGINRYKYVAYSAYVKQRGH